MRRFILIIMMLSFAALPASGQVLAHADAHHETQIMHIAGTADTTSTSGHCDSSAESVAPEPVAQSAELHDCCDGAQGCGMTECPSDCGHCFAQGHGSCATFGHINVQELAASTSGWAPLPSYHSRATTQPTPPPNSLL